MCPVARLGEGIKLAAYEALGISSSPPLITEEKPLGTIEMLARKSVRKGEKTSIESLFPYGERRKQFELKEDVRRWKTKLRVEIFPIPPADALDTLKAWREGVKIELPKLVSFITLADITKRKGEKTSINGLLASTTRKMPFIAEESVREGEQLILQCYVIL